jgi:pimeloyl-ACP methyl ester carboxylesterase
MSLHQENRKMTGAGAGRNVDGLACDRLIAAEPTVDSNRCRYTLEGDGPLLVYIPGLDGTGELFFKQKPGLVGSFKVASIRLRDQGRFTYDDLTGDVAAIIKEAGQERAIILGESFGGTVAISFALRFPEMVERLVIVNSFPRFRGRLRIKLAARLSLLIPFRAVWYFRKAASTVGLLIDRVPAEDRRRFFEAVKTVMREGYARRLQLISEVNLEERLSQIRVPTLLIAGDKDMLVPSVEEARRMARLIPNATVEVIKGAGHACLLGDKLKISDLLAR